MFPARSERPRKDQFGSQNARRSGCWVEMRPWNRKPRTSTATAAAMSSGPATARRTASARSRPGPSIRAFNPERASRRGLIGMGGRACTNPPLARIRSELSVLRTALILLLLIVPGLAGTFALFDPDEIDPVTRLALVFAIGFAVDAAVAFVLMLAHVLLPWTWLALSIAVTAALVVMAVRRRLGPQLR